MKGSASQAGSWRCVAPAAASSSEASPTASTPSACRAGPGSASTTPSCRGSSSCWSTAITRTGSAGTAAVTAWAPAAPWACTGSTTGSSCSREAASAAAAWSSLRTAPVCGAGAGSSPTSTLSGCTGTARGCSTRSPTTEAACTWWSGASSATSERGRGSVPRCSPSGESSTTSNHEHPPGAGLLGWALPLQLFGPWNKLFTIKSWLEARSFSFVA